MANLKSLLPIDCSDGFILDQKIARTIGEGLVGEYAFAEPYPHIVIDNFLPNEIAEELLSHFPVDNKKHDKTYQKGYGGSNKRQILPYDCDLYIRNAFSFFNSAPMLQFLGGVTNINGLLPDPYFSGGGFHEIQKNGLLGIHADFRVNESLQTLRRVNMLIYLNKDWRDSYGGKLELWDKQMNSVVKSISPLFNRCVIFNTDEDSFHGHPDPLTTPDGVTRKSIALYYYTAMPIKNDSGESRHTRYVARPNDTEQVKAEVTKLAKKRQKRAKKLFNTTRKRSLKEKLMNLKISFFNLFN
jgi:hypothetical protein